MSKGERAAIGIAGVIGLISGVVGLLPHMARALGFQ